MRRHPKMPKTPEFRKYFSKIGFSTFFTPNPNFPKNSFKKQVISDYRTFAHFGLSHFTSFLTIALSDYRTSDY